MISIGLAAMMSFTALTCSAATAYAEEKKDEVAGGKDVTISIMGRKVEIHDAMLEAADRYMELQPNVTVVMETVAGGDDFLQAERGSGGHDLGGQPDGSGFRRGVPGAVRPGAQAGCPGVHYAAGCAGRRSGL